ncbi:tetratricopeptide repeat protein [Bdellovibrionota bacterium]
MKTQHPVHTAMAEGDRWIQRGKLTRAKEAFLSVLKLDDKFEPAILRLASVALKEENNELASSYFQKVGELAVQRNLQTKAIRAYHRALQCTPHNRELLEKVKTLYLNLGRDHEAVRLIEKFKPQEQESPPEECKTESKMEEQPDPQEEESSIAETEQTGVLQKQKTAEAEQTEPSQELNPETDSRPTSPSSLADMTEEAIDVLAEIEILAGEGAFEQAELLLMQLQREFPNHKYLSEISERIKRKEHIPFPVSTTSSDEPEIDFTGAIQ